jgi:translocation and assembly module TamB
VRRAVVFVGEAAFWIVFFSLALACSLLVHLDLPSARRIAANAVNAVLAQPFKGKIVVDGVRDLGMRGLRGGDAWVEAPDGRRVIVARGVRARVNPAALVKTLLARRGEIGIGVFDVDVDSAEVVLDEDADGHLLLEDTFAARAPSVDEDSGPPGRPLAVMLPNVHVKHAWVHGKISGAPFIDADADDVHGSVNVGHDVQVDITHAVVASRSIPRGANVAGAVHGHVSVPAKTGRDVGIRGTFDGTIGAIPLRAFADFDGDALRASVDVPKVDAAKVRAIAPEAAVFAPVEVHAQAYGPFREIYANAHADVGGGEVDVTAHAALVPHVFGTAHVDARKIDARVFAPTAPATRLAGAVDVGARLLDDDAFRGTFAIAMQPGVVSAEHVPATRVRGSFEGAGAHERSADAFTLRAQGSIAEPGAPTDVDLELRGGKSSTTITGKSHTTVERLEDVTRVSGLGLGRADVSTEGTLVLGRSSRLDADVQATLEGVSRGGVAVTALVASGSVHGALDDPTIDATIDASDVHAGTHAWTHVQARATGTLRKADVAATAEGAGAPDVAASARLAIERATTISDVDVTVSRSDRTLHAIVPRIVVGGGDLEIDGAEVSGAGAPLHATIAMRPKAVAVRADSQGFDVGVAASALGLDDHVHAGIVVLTADVHAREDGADGIAHVELSNGAFDDVTGIAARIDAAMDEREVSGTAHAEVPGLGALDVTRSSVTIGGKGALDVAGWRRAYGRLHLDGQLDLARAKRVFAPDAKHIAELGGVLLFTAHASRASETDDKPDLKVSLSTRGLLIAGRREPVAPQAPERTRTKTRATTIVSEPTWQLRGIDASIDAQANGASNFAELSARVSDRLGPLAILNAKSNAAPYVLLFSHGTDTQERLLNVPVSAHVMVPARKITDLPDLIRPQAAQGVVALDAQLDGTALDPQMTLDTTVAAVRFGTGLREPAIDARLHAAYEGKALDATVDVGPATEPTMHATIHANADAKQLLTGPGEPAWNASARAKLSRFKLGSVSMLSDRDVRGSASGDVAIDGLHENARANASITVENLRIGRARYTKATVDAQFDGKTLAARAHVEQKDGVADATATAPLAWGANLAPSLDPAGAASAELHAKGFRAAILEPFVSSAVDTLDGLIDADARLSLAPGKKPEMAGAVALRDGRVDISALGEELHGVNAKATFSPDGTVKIENAVAYGTTGKVTASAVARLDGTSLAEATANVDVKKGEAIPFAVSGTNMGTAYGRVQLRAKTVAESRRTELTIGVPELHVLLPDAPPHSVQDLDPQPDTIHIGVMRAPHEFTVLEPTGEAAKKKSERTGGEAPASLAIALELGDVEVRRGTDLAVTLGGAPTLLVTDHVSMHGQIALKHGKLEVQGKSFHINKGTATFLDDPSNPEVSVSASWKAPDGTEIVADYVGPLKTGKVTLRADPPRPQNEIIALILFGTANGAQPTGYGQQQSDTATQAGTAVGAFAVGGLNKGIDKLTGMQITAKVDTGQANARPEVEVQISRSLSVELAFVLGTPPPGTNPDTTYATIDWRFVRNWSLATTVGNQGSTMADVLWRYRY